MIRCRWIYWIFRFTTQSTPDDMDVSAKVSYSDVPVLPPPPSFECFAWPNATGGSGSDPYLFDFSAELPGWFPLGLVGTSGDQPSLQISPILSNTPEESVVGSPASSREEPDMPFGTGSLPDALSGSSVVDLSQLRLTSPSVVFSGISDCPTRRIFVGLRTLFLIGGWGLFLSERSPSSLNCFGDGCSFRQTTYRPSDYTRQSIWGVSLDIFYITKALTNRAKPYAKVSAGE